MNTQENPTTENTGRPRHKLFFVAGAVVVILLAVVIIAVIYMPSDQVGDDTVEAAPATAQQVLARVQPLLRVSYGPQASRADQMSRAADIMAGYIETAPDDVRVRAVLAQTLITLGRFDQAQATVDKLLELSPENADGLWAQGKLLHASSIDGSYEFFRRAADAPDSGAHQWASFGLAAIQADQPKLAQEYLAKAVKAGMQDQRVFAALGEIALSAVEVSDAQYYFKEALKLKGADQNASLWSGLAGAQILAGRPDEAVETLTSASERLRRWRDRSEIMVQLGTALAMVRRTSEAAAAYSAGSDGLPKSPAAALSAAKCYWQLGQYAQAMKYIDRAFELEDDSGEIAQWKSKIERSRFADPN